MSLNRGLQILWLVCISGSIGSGCKTPATLFEGNTDISIIDDDKDGDGKRDTQIPIDPREIVCDPFSSNPDRVGTPRIGPRQGLVGTLRYLEKGLRPDGSYMYTKVDDYLKFGKDSNLTLFFDRLNVPTRPWDRGFTNRDGEVFKNPLTKEALYEYFALEIKSQLKLGAKDMAGDYQLALLSDDGAALEVKDANSPDGYRNFIDNDGVHPTRMGCSFTSVHLEKNTAIPFKLKYYQGPRYHISLVLMWRPVPKNGDKNESLCGQEGNDLFYDSSTNPATPQKAYRDLEARGWRPLEADNFLLQADSYSNPCDFSNF